jgi:curved DNA-binding protein CbpA
MASVSSQDKNIRKAIKKLKEIDVLKTCTYRNAEEDEKIEKESFYRRILDPSYKTDEEMEQERRRYDMLQKQLADTKRRQCERHQKNQKRKLENAEKERKRQEESRKQEARGRSKATESRSYTWESAHVCIDPLEEEYISMLRDNNNDNSRTFRKLSMKYHPDKNLDKQKWAEEKQKHLETIRSRFECYQ